MPTLRRLRRAAPVGCRGPLWLTLVVGLLAGLVAGPALALTEAAGPIAADTRWTLEGSPYRVTADLVVQGGATLTIEAGVVVSMAPGTRLTVEAGTLRVLGSAAAPVRVQSDRTRLGEPAAPGDWGPWVLGPGTSPQTLLEHAILEHGRGLQVLGSAPVLNHLDIRQQQGAAISIDLAASPRGVGNRASGNGVNGIAVPAGAIAGSTRWGLRGLPYHVAGPVSVGVPPALAAATPASVEQGQTLVLALSGTRLTGAGAATFDRPGLALTPFGTGSATQVFYQLSVAADAPLGPAALRLSTDAGEVALAAALTVTPPLPAITAIAPTSITAGTGVSTLTLDGRNFVAASVVTANAADLPTEFISATQLRAQLPQQTQAATLALQVRSPNLQQPAQPLLSNSVALSVLPPVPPVVTIEPTPIALPPDGSSREVTVRLSKADFRDHTLNFAISDTTKATVSPASVLVPAGQTVLKIAIVPKASGTVSLTMNSPTLAAVSVPLFITTDYRGANTSYAARVGVFIPDTAAPGTDTRSVTQGPVSVAVGAVLTATEPAAWSVGSSGSLTVRGAGIPAGAQVLVVPAAGLTLGPVAVSADGTRLDLPVTTAADAVPGPRRLVVRDAAGKDIMFADPAQATVQVLSGAPAIDSIEPLFGARGSTLRLLVRGRHLQQGRLQVLPGNGVDAGADGGVLVDAAPVISADGSTLTAWLQVAADAPPGVRVVQVVTPAGSSTPAATAANSFSVVSQVRSAVTPISSAAVGVVIPGAAALTEPVQPGSAVVGVLLGSGVTQVQPRAAVIGTDTVVTVRGGGLQGVTAVGVVPATGVTLLAGPEGSTPAGPNGPWSVNEAGTELQFTLRVAPDAALGPRRLVLTATDRPVPFAQAADGPFVISAPVPEAVSVEPQVLLAGASAVRLTLRGRNFVNITGARIEPAQGISVSGPYDAAADGSSLSFSAAVAAAAASGVRTVIVASAAGESTAEPLPGNTVRIAQQAGPTYAHLPARPVGVQIGPSGAPLAVPGTLATRAVGVMIGTAPVAQPETGTAASAGVQVVAGSAAWAMSPGGWLQGASGTLTVQGQGLEAVATVEVKPATGILLGTPTVAGGGVSLSIAVAPDAPQVPRQLRLRTAAGTEVLFVQPEAAQFGIGSLPVMTSVSPIVLEQGKGATLTVRGSNLRGVTRIVFDPDSGLASFGTPQWSQDALGELLTVPVTAAVDAALGQRVVRLLVPGGGTDGAATPANTVSIVGPQ